LPDLLALLENCSKRVKEEVLRVLGSAEAAASLGVGAGGDVMREIDLVAERAIVETLLDRGVSCTVISEEAGVRKVGSKAPEFYLTVDPLDGTTNALRGLPFMCTSLAVSKRPQLREVEAGLVADLLHDVTYTAEKGRGARRNKGKISPSQKTSLEDGVVGVDFNSFQGEGLEVLLAAVIRNVKHIRHLGANALEVCYVSDGTTDAFIDLRKRIRVTDIAAAYLILREAGGLMVTPEGEEMDAPLDPAQRVSFIAAANPSVYEGIQRLLTRAER